jgi:hypothetical protein
LTANDDERKERLKVKVRRLEADRYRLPGDRSSDLEGLMVSGCLWWTDIQILVS